MEDTRAFVCEMESMLVTEQSKLSTLEETSSNLLEEVVGHTRAVEEDLAKAHEKLWLSWTESLAHTEKLIKAREDAARSNRDMDLSLIEDPNIRTVMKAHLEVEEDRAAQKREATAAGRIPKDDCVIKLVEESRQKSYSDQKRRSVEFQVGDHVFLRVSPLRGVKRFGVRGKLSPRFVGPFEVLERIGEVAYRLAMPPALSGVHDVFHVSMLRKYVSDSTHVLSYENLELDRDLSYEEKPVQILDRKDKALRSKTIPLVKVLWRNSKVEEATWELESDMRERHPE
ncbi:uncharacterized protein LOC133806379, partial [Humulus lupulus]|uniref:uncharacterized protein LOC133806379 n=1 Tax=Humulus lupulus TaxID=3486 RepID=UPI002B407595